MVRALLTPSGAELLTAQVSSLTESRARVVDAADAERRRIERDLHDGAQQRLVVAGHEPRPGQGEARLRPRGRPRAGRPRRTSEAKDSIAELRNVVRGVHPAC